MKVDEECMTDEIPIRSKRVVREVNSVFGRNTILVNENGSQDLWSYHFPYYTVLGRGVLCSSRGPDLYGVRGGCCSRGEAGKTRLQGCMYCRRRSFSNANACTGYCQAT
jgi:hypothetical protein